MPRYNERSTRQSRFSEEEEPRSTSRRPSSKEAGSKRYKQQKQQTKVNYCTLFALFANEHAGGRLQVDIRAFQGEENSVEDFLSLEEFLFLCEKIYYGEAKLTGSLWECDERFASHTGNIRMSEEQIEELKEEFEEQAGGKKTPAKSVAKTSAKRKPAYEVPETEEEEDDYEEVEEVKPKSKRPTPVKPAVELDMETEEIEGEEANIPY